MYLRKRGSIRTISDHQLVKLISRMKSRVMGSMGKLAEPWNHGMELMVDSPETLMMISSSRSLPEQGEGGINKLDIDSRLFEVNLG
jgi:hypothetical protein